MHRREDPAAWIKHQKRSWQAGVQERKRRKLAAAKAAAQPHDPSKAPRGITPTSVLSQVQLEEASGVNTGFAYRCIQLA